MASVRDLAFKQWRELRDALLGLGVQMEEITPQPGLPDLVFTANAGLMFRERFSVRASCTRSGRRNRPFSTPGFGSMASRCVHWPAGMYHEGAGDALFCGDALFAGYRTRSDALAHQWVAEQVGRAESCPSNW